VLRCFNDLLIVAFIRESALFLTIASFLQTYEHHNECAYLIDYLQNTVVDATIGFQKVLPV